ncbi:MAG: 30S ribosomal protein S3 [Candidatus Nanoarchaeia archaeon]
MIERKFVSQNVREFEIKKFIKDELSKVGLSSVSLQRTSLGERVVIRASRPGLIVGRGGSTIQKLTKDLKKRFSLENPQIEIEEIKDFTLDAAVVAESIVSQLERFGSQRFKGIGHKTVESVMRAGALGVEILISGKIPAARSKTWRFTDGYMKKCGDLAISGVDTAIHFAKLKTGVIGIQVRILPSTVVLPDQISFDKREKQAAAKAEEEAKLAAREAAKKKRESKKSEDTSSSAEKKPTKKSSKKSSTKKNSKKSSPKEKTEDKKSEETKKVEQTAKAKDKPEGDTQ